MDATCKLRNHQNLVCSAQGQGYYFNLQVYYSTLFVTINQGWEFAYSLKIAHFNEQLWAICSGLSWQMSDGEQLAQVTHDKRANHLFFFSELLIRSFTYILQKFFVKKFSIF